MGGSTLYIDEKTISAAIVESVKGRAYEIATDKEQFELGTPHKPKISGYATPKYSLVAISSGLVRIDQILFAGRTLAVSGDILKLKRLLQ
jgi:hypothetical protein